MATDNAPSSPSGLSFIGLPTELHLAVASHLPNSDIKNLRLACRLLGETVLLRIDRVFLSAYPLNIEVFRAIADHEAYRRRVVELVWDDATLYGDTEPEEAWKSLFEWHCEKNVREAKERMYHEEERPDHAARTRWMAAQPPLDVLWAQYKDMLEQRDKAIASSDDVKALQYGLQRFPSLRRVTLTPAAHGAPFCPLYQTPMIRALPYGFNYPIPRGWPTQEPYEQVPIAPWHDSRGGNTEKNRWRGFIILMEGLGCVDHHISEFVVDVSLLNTGLNSHMFDEPCEEYDNLAKLLRTPGFRRIDLAVNTDGQAHNGWPAFSNGHFQRALGEATDLEHVGLRTNAGDHLDGEDWDQDPRYFVPLRTVFPVDKWPKLRHFGLSGFIVRLADVLSLLAELPATVRTVELSFLRFQEGYGSHNALLIAIRDKLGWRERAVDDRPRIVMAWNDDQIVPKSGRAVWVDDEVNEFVYGNGVHPFPDHMPDDLGTGTTGTERDLFEPAHSRHFMGY